MAGTNVTNGGSAIGEAIGHYMEMVVQKHIENFLNENYNCHFIRQTGYNSITGKTSKKLLLYDEYGNDYDIDGLITDESMRPLVLLESKYIRYKKHNRDKGSWICNAHSAIRKRYSSIRGSIAVLAGSWSKSSLRMIASYDVNYFVIGFDKIADLLAEKGIDFRWEEKEYSKALLAWRQYCQLSEEEKLEIAVKMVDEIKDSLDGVLRDLLDENKAREVKKIAVEIKTTKGEYLRYVFNAVSEAIEFLETLSLDEEFNSTSMYTIFDIPLKED